MYTKDQASSIRQAFWKAFGQYMSLHNSAEDVKINWVNYKTGIKYLNFKMQADNSCAVIFIEMSHPDIGIQELMLAQFAELEPLLNIALNEQWVWTLHSQNEQGQIVTTISKRLEDVNVFRSEDWAEIISFFKPRIMALDKFWVNAQYGFELFG